jgi:hypothetical protein
MQTRVLLVLSFIVISLVPASILSTISFFSLSRLEQSISNLYFGTVTIISNLSDGHKALVDMRLNIGRFISTTNGQEEQRILDQINQNEGVFLKTLIEYKQIDDFPLQVEILQHRGQGNLTSYESSLLTQVNSDWREYQQARNKVIDLTNAGSRENATAYSNTIAADKFSKLAESYNKIVDLNNNLASIMFDESQSVGKQAYAAAIITSVSSVGFAIAAAIFISKRLAPSVDELQREAKKKIEKFISQGGSSSTLPQTTTTDVQSEGAEMILPVSIGRSSDDDDDDNSGNNNMSTEIQQQLANLVKKGPMILLHSSQYEEPEARGKMSEEREQRKGSADSLLDYYFLSTSQSLSSLSSTAAESVASAAAREKNKKINNLVLITKRTSNLYLRGRSAGAAMYILSSSAQDPITTSEDGLLVISIGQTSLILEAIKRTLRENPSSVIVLDNLTELIYKIGFAKVFSLVQSISDEVSQYSHSRILILINENAHPRGEVEAIATICNAFIR